MESFSNYQVELNALPQLEGVEYYPISGKYLIKRNIQTSIFMLVVFTAWTFFYFFSFNPTTVLVSGILLPLFFIFKFWNNFKVQKSYGYALREKDVLYRRGFFVNAITVVPFNRIQHASVNRDVWDKFLGISSLQIFTAGGSGSDIGIPGLEPELALRLKEALAGKISEDEE